MQENATLNYQNDEYIHTLKNGEKGVIAELEGSLTDRDKLICAANNLLHKIKDISVQFIAYVSPKNNEQRYFISLIMPDVAEKEKVRIKSVEYFKDIINVCIGDFSFLDKTSLDNLLNDIFLSGTWNGISLSDTKTKKANNVSENNITEEELKTFDVERQKHLDYSINSTIWTLNLSNKKPIDNSLGYKIKRYILNPPYFELLGKIDNALYGKINISTGFFWQEPKYTSSNPRNKTFAFNSFLPFGFNRKKYKDSVYSVDGFKDIPEIMYPATLWHGTENKTVPVILNNGIKTGFDVFDGSSHYSGTIIGQNSGKSSLINYMAYWHYVKGDRIFIFPMNDQDSYIDLLKKTSGQEIILDINNPVSVNPFSLIKNEDLFKEYREILVEWIYLTATDKDDKKRGNIPETDNDYKYLIKYNIDKALSELWTEHKDNLTLKIVADFIKTKNNAELSTFLERLNLFIKSYGKFFTGKSEVYFNKPFVVINTSNIDSFSHPILSGVLITAMDIHIKIYQDKNRTSGYFKRSLVFIDRFEELLDNIPEIEESTWFFYRGAAKSGISLFYSITTDIGRFTEEKQLNSAKRFLECSIWIFITPDMSGSIYNFSEVLLTALAGAKNFTKAKRLKQGEFLLVNRSNRYSAKIKLILCDGI